LKRMRALSVRHPMAHSQTISEHTKVRNFTQNRPLLEYG
jgi:hypothetical protein